MRIIVTGIAGFIGFHLAKKMALAGHTIIGIDVINDYYDVGLKLDRLAELGVQQVGDLKNGEPYVSDKLDIRFYRTDLCDKAGLRSIVKAEVPDAICNLAAQAGVRFSLEKPHSYIDSNITGFLNVLEVCREFGIENLSYASSSSVYGLNESLPLVESMTVDHPVSLYAASKRSNELMAHAYSHLFGIKTTGLRFFTVYGPWGRPDMALFMFVRAALRGEPIYLNNHGNMSRDFTFIDDIIQGIQQVVEKSACTSEAFDSKEPKPNISSAPYRLFNIGNSNPIRLDHFVDEIERQLGMPLKREYRGMQPGDVVATFADSSSLSQWGGYKPTTDVATGVEKFITWFISYYGEKPR